MAQSVTQESELLTTSTAQQPGIDELLSANSLLTTMMDNLPQHVMLLNPMRQVIYLNASLREFVRENGTEITAGMRPGELFACDHSLAAENGCGTALTCRTCGALTSILAALDGKAGTNECRIIRKRDNRLNALDFSVWASPVAIEDNRCVLVLITDVTAEKRLLQLDGKFLHDIKNSALSINYLTTLLQDERTTVEEARSGLLTASDRMLAEIKYKQLIHEAEHGYLELDAGPCQIDRLLEQLVTRHSAASPAIRIAVKEDNASSADSIVSDNALLGQVIGYLLENALAAVPADGEITLHYSCRSEAVIECLLGGPLPNIQKPDQCHSPHGMAAGNGISAYCIKLLIDRYLHGTVSFGPSTGSGTLFRLTLPLDIRTAG